MLMFTLTYRLEIKLRIYINKSVTFDAMKQHIYSITFNSHTRQIQWLCLDHNNYNWTMPCAQTCCGPELSQWTDSSGCDLLQRRSTIRKSLFNKCNYILIKLSPACLIYIPCRTQPKLAKNHQYFRCLLHFWHLSLLGFCNCCRVHVTDHWFCRLTAIITYII